MKTTALFSFFFLSFVTYGLAQTTTAFVKPTVFEVPALFAKPTQNAIPAANLNALTKLQVDAIQPQLNLPDNYNWSAALHIRNAFKNMALQNPSWDCKFRELPPDAMRIVTTELLYKNSLFAY
jgi:hypothetical protein